MNIFVNTKINHGNAARPIALHVGGNLSIINKNKIISKQITAFNMNINDSFIKTVGDNGAKDILSEIGEITIDSVVNNEAINQIPIIGTLRSLYKITTSVSDYLFIQKLLKFFQELGEISGEEKENMKKKIQSDTKYRNKVGDHLLEIINKIDDTDKPKLIAKLFRAYIDNKIDLNEFFKYSQIINKSFLPDLFNINKYLSGETVTIEESSSLLSLGLIEVKTKTQTKNIRLGSIGMNNQIEFILNPVGKKLFSLIN